jgi:deoxyribodipyrimidine photo-lyase
MRATGDAFPTAYAFRRYVQRTLSAQVGTAPAPNPLEDAQGLAGAVLPAVLTERWPAADFGALLQPEGLRQLPIDHGVAPTTMRGGPDAAQQALRRFLDTRLERYAHDRNDASEQVTSGLSPYLHFGHVSSHDVVSRVLEREGWLGDLTRKPTGARDGWWGVSAAAEAFLDQVVTWRELGFNMCAARPGDYQQYSSLPAWARATLESHADDPRDHVYSRDAFERGATHDPLWNAAQMQLVRQGTIHNYLRMLWGKKILEWTASPEDALAVTIELNNKYALDGRDPNSYSGIFWTLGRYDRPWAPERPVFGTVRYMSSANTARKMDVRGYLDRFAPGRPEQPTLWESPTGDRA